MHTADIASTFRLLKLHHSEDHFTKKVLYFADKSKQMCHNYICMYSMESLFLHYVRERVRLSE